MTGVGLGLSIVRSIVNTLNGSISIQSQPKVGTEVTVQVPLVRVTGKETSVSTPSTAASGDDVHDYIDRLRDEHGDKNACLYGFTTTAETGTGAGTGGKILEAFVTRWLNLNAVVDDLAIADVVIVDEKNAPSLLRSTMLKCPVVVLCSTSRYSRGCRPSSSVPTEFVSKPFGPFKLAKALSIVMEKCNMANASITSSMRMQQRSLGSENQGVLVAGFRDMQLEDPNEKTPMAVKSDGIAIASDSANAQMAMGSHSGEHENQEQEAGTDFPFPAVSNDIDNVRHSGMMDAASPKHDETPRALAPRVHLGVENVPPQDQLLPSSVQSPPSRKRTLRALLVEDNAINLTMLKKYMSKANILDTCSAINGQLAVDAVKSATRPFDIIFMDISMPVMNGFEATRVIRAIEDKAVGEGAALIVALTGLASAVDQAEAFAAGVDLYFTKPVSFKDIGKMLDKWEAEKEAFG